MPAPLLFDIIESPEHPDLSTLAADLGFEREVFTSQRKAMGRIKRQAPALVVADFFYGFGNNYAGANVCNLDVLLRSLQRFAPDAAIVILANRQQMPHVPKLAALFKLHAVVTLPTSDATLGEALSGTLPT